MTHTQEFQPSRDVTEGSLTNSEINWTPPSITLFARYVYSEIATRGDELRGQIWKSQ